MQLYLKEPMAIRGRAICALLTVFLLSGCGGYFSGQWPNLAEGFADAAERDEALAEAASEPPEPAAAVAAAASPAESAPPEPEVTLSPEDIAGLAARLDAADGAIAEERQAYVAAKVNFLARGKEGTKEGVEEAARGRWLTAQLRLTGLSRSGDGLIPLLQELQPAARHCPGNEQDEICALWRRAEDAAAALAAYLAEQRRFLAAQDPAGPP
jgi:hypothetical protein